MNSGLKPCLKLDLALGIFMNEREWQQQQHLRSNNNNVDKFQFQFQLPLSMAICVYYAVLRLLQSALGQDTRDTSRYKIQDTRRAHVCEAGAPGQIMNPVPGTVAVAVAVAGGFLVRFPWPNEARVTSPQFINKIH